MDYTTEYVDVTLSRPIGLDGTQVTSLRIREPTVQDQIACQAVKGSTAQQEVALIANLCSVSPDDILKLSMRDYKKIQEAFANFLE